MKVRYQSDFYVKKNSCQKSLSAQLKVLSFSIEIPSSQLLKNFIIAVNERNSKFSQTIIFNGKNWFYPTWGGHKEFGLPKCKEQVCTIRFFVFLSDLVLSQQHWFFDLKMYEHEKNYKNSDSWQMPLVNNFKTKSELLFEDLDLKQNKNEISAMVDLKKLKQIIEDGYNIRMIYQWRTSKEQQQYFEETQIFNSQALEGTKFKMKTKVLSPSYLGFMIFVTKGNEAFESKVEIINQNDSYYTCQ